MPHELSGGEQQRVAIARSLVTVSYTHLDVYKRQEQHKASKLRLYEKYAAGSITKEAYIQQKATADVKIAENDGVIQRSHERMKELDSETACSDEKLDAVCEQYADCKALTYDCLLYTSRCV